MICQLEEMKRPIAGIPFPYLWKSQVPLGMPEIMGWFGLLKLKPQDLYTMTLLTLVPALHQLIGNTIFCYFGAHGGEEN